MKQPLLQDRFLPPAALGLGLLGAVLRRVQMTAGFEPDTGLAIQGSWINILIPVFLAVLFVVMAAPIWGEKAEKLRFEQCFAPLEGIMPALLAAGAFLFLISGGLYFLRYFQGEAMVLDIVLGGFAACITLSQLYALRRWKAAEGLEGIFLLPPVVFFLLSLMAAHLAHGTYPVTARYGVGILAMAALVYGFYQVAAAGYGQGSSRGLCRGLGLGIAMGFTASADLLDIAESLSMIAGALILLAYALSRQDLEEEAEDPEEPDAAAEMEAE